MSTPETHSVADSPPEEFYWAAPTLTPRDYSLVVRGGDDGMACFIRGNNNILAAGPQLTQGYVERKYVRCLGWVYLTQC